MEQYGAVWSWSYLANHPEALSDKLMAEKNFFNFQRAVTEESGGKVRLNNLLICGREINFYAEE